MKMTTSPKPTLASLLGVSLLALCAAGAQTTQFYTDPGSGSNAAAGGVSTFGNLDSIGWDMVQWNATAGVPMMDTGINQTNPYVNAAVPARYINFSAPGLPATVGTDVLDSVTLYFYVTAMNPDNTNLGFSIYDGMSGGGNLIQTLNLTGPAPENQFLSLTLTAAQFLGGFSITSTGLPSNASLQFASEENLTAFQHPGLLATYSPVPEPSAALLGAVAALGLLRRRRA